MRSVGRPKCAPGEETVTFAVPRALVSRLTKQARQEILQERRSVTGADGQEAPHCNREPTPHEINRRARALMTRAIDDAFTGPGRFTNCVAPSRRAGAG